MSFDILSRYMLLEQLKQIKKELGLERDDKDALLAKFSDRIATLEVRCRLAFTRYCHDQYLMVYAIQTGGRWGFVYCAIVVQ